MVRKTEPKPTVEPVTVDSPETADISVEQGHFDPETGRVYPSVTHLERERQGAPNR